MLHLAKLIPSLLTLEKENKKKYYNQQPQCQKENKYILQSTTIMCSCPSLFTWANELTRIIHIDFKLAGLSLLR